MTFTKRALGALAAGALALPFLASPALAAPGDTPIPTPRDIRSFCQLNPDSPSFPGDVAPTDTTEAALAIRCLATAGIALGNPGTPSQPQGIGADRYGPQLNVTRGQMASFIARMIDAANARELRDGEIRALPAPGATNPFPGDVPANYVHLNNIKRLTQAGIVTGNPGTQQQPNGIGADRYGPDLFVTRSQMASFINRAVAYVTTNLGAEAVRTNAGNSAGFQAANAEFYLDQQQQEHVRNVNGITAARIANGTSNADGTPTRRYDGLGNVTRQQMARFIARTLSTFFSGDEAAGVARLRIGGLLETLTEPFDNDSVAFATRVGSSGNAALTDANSRTYRATGLTPGVQYRITLVAAGNVTRATPASNEVRFATGSASGTNFLVNTGPANATIVSVNGQPAVNNSGAGEQTSPNTDAPRTAVVTVGADGTLTFVIRGEVGAEVEPVIYRNGGGNQTSYQTGGGASPFLEVDREGRPIEFFGLLGQTNFVAAPRQ